MMRPIHTIAATRVDHGGPSRSVPALCDSLALLDVDVQLVCGIPADASVVCCFPSDKTRVHVAQQSTWLGNLSIARRFPKLLDQLCASALENCLIHDHGIWLQSNHAVSKFSRKHHIRQIVSPRGMLSNWSMSRRAVIKRCAWIAYQYRDLLLASAFHATSAEEAEDIRALGFKQPIAIIPNGVSVPCELPKRATDATRRVLFLSRIHPVKGLLNLVHAWKQAGPRVNWKLTIAGPDIRGHRKEVEELVATLGLSEEISFTGAEDDQSKWQLLMNSDLFVLPSFSENFGMVIAEAMAAGLPVITTTGTPWQVIKERRLGWWVDPSVDAIARALKQATSMTPSTLEEMGSRAAQLVREEFSWGQAAQKMRGFYEHLLYNLPKPEYVR